MATTLGEGATLHSFLRTKPPIDPGKKMDFMVLISATDCNPNGDPDGNCPRHDQETSHGLISNVSMKRHIRDTAAILAEGKPGFELYVTRHSILDHKLQAIHAQVGIKPTKKGKKKDEEAPAGEPEEAEGQPIDKDLLKKAQQLACSTYIDNRWFGAVMSSKVANCGQVRGAFQLGWARTIDPVLAVDDSLVLGAVHTDKEAETNKMLQTFGNRNRVAFGLYKSEGYFTPAFAQATGVSAPDIELFWECLVRMYEYNRSSSRDGIVVEKVIVFEHDSPLGRAPAHKLFRMVNVKRKDESKPSRHVDDYTISTQEEVENRIKNSGYSGVKVHYLA